MTKERLMTDVYRTEVLYQLEVLNKDKNEMEDRWYELRAELTEVERKLQHCNEGIKWREEILDRITLKPIE